MIVQCASATAKLQTSLTASHDASRARHRSEAVTSCSYAPTRERYFTVPTVGTMHVGELAFVAARRRSSTRFSELSVPEAGHDVESSVNEINVAPRRLRLEPRGEIQAETDNITPTAHAAESLPGRVNTLFGAPVAAMVSLTRYCWEEAAAVVLAVMAATAVGSG